MDWVSPSPEKSEAMRKVRTSGTAPELALRSRLHSAGLRFRVTYPIPERPRRSIDLAFTRMRVAVFVDGCFWHGCPLHGGTPTTNRSFWAAKRNENLARDQDTNLCLERAGWTVLRLWEHTVPDLAFQTVLMALGKRCDKELS